jgi:hypothetical protein
VTLQSAENRDWRNWLDARCVNFCCEECWKEWNDNDWFVELKRKHENDYWVWLDDLSFRRKFDWFNDWSFCWYFIWDFNEKWFFALFLDLDNRRDTINDFVEAQHSTNVIFLVFYEHNEERIENKLFSFRDWFAFHSVTRCLDSTKMSKKWFSLRVNLIKNNWLFWLIRFIICRSDRRF